MYSTANNHEQAAERTFLLWGPWAKSGPCDRYAKNVILTWPTAYVLFTFRYKYKYNSLTKSLFIYLFIDLSIFMHLYLLYYLCTNMDICICSSISQTCDFCQQDDAPTFLLGASNSFWTSGFNRLLEAFIATTSHSTQRLQPPKMNKSSSISFHPHVWDAKKVEFFRVSNCTLKIFWEGHCFSGEVVL